MFLLLSKLIPALLYPVSLVCILSLITGVLALRRKAKGAAILAFISFFILYVTASPITRWVLLHNLESRYPEPKSYPHAAAIVVLGGTLLPDIGPRLHPEAGSSGDRLLQAARLWQQHLAPRIVATGGFIPFLSTYRGNEASLYARLFTELFNVPDDSILRVPKSKTTYEDALYTHQLFDSLGMKKEILLVTSARHMPRSVGLFHKQGFTVYPAPADFRETANLHFNFFLLLPSESSLSSTIDAFHEYIGLIVYHFTGRL